VGVGVGEDIAKEMSKADNKVIRYGLMGMLLIIILSFVYTEQIKSVPHTVREITSNACNYCPPLLSVSDMVVMMRRR